MGCSSTFEIVSDVAGFMGALLGLVGCGTFAGWRGVSQWVALQGQQTLMEQVIQEMAA